MTTTDTTIHIGHLASLPDRRAACRPERRLRRRRPHRPHQPRVPRPGPGHREPCSPATGSRRRRGRHPAHQPGRARRHHVRHLATRRRAHPGEPEPHRHARPPSRSTTPTLGSSSTKATPSTSPTSTASTSPTCQTEGRPRRQLPPVSDPTAVALLIYTSGTTGTPEGRDARPRQPHRHGRDDHRGAAAGRGRPLPADPAAVPRQRHRRQRAVPARRRRRHVDHRALLGLDASSTPSKRSVPRTSPPSRPSTPC